MKILLVDDHLLVGNSLEQAMINHSDVSEFYYLSQPELIDEIIEEFMPDVILLDIHMGDYNGFDIARELLVDRPAKLVFLTGYNLPEYRYKAEEIGMDGFIDKAVSVERLMIELTKIVENDARYFEEWRDQTVNLTNRERQILQMVSDGYKQVAMGIELGISERTVRNHISNINEKMDTTSTLESVIRAIELGILDIGK